MPSLSAEKDNVISFTDVTIVEDRKIPLCQWGEDAKSRRKILVGHSEVKNIFLSTASDRQESARNYIKMYWKLVVAPSRTTRGHQGVILNSCTIRANVMTDTLKIYSICATYLL